VIPPILISETLEIKYAVIMVKAKEVKDISGLMKSNGIRKIIEYAVYRLLYGKSIAPNPFGLAGFEKVSKSAISYLPKTEAKRNACQFSVDMSW